MNSPVESAKPAFNEVAPGPEVVVLEVLGEDDIARKDPERKGRR